MSTTNTSSSGSSIPGFNFMPSLINEIKKFYQNTHQLNILLQETNNACKELKLLQQSTLTDHIENLQINEKDDKLIKALSTMKICFVIFGQNVLAKSILVNELLSRYLLPFQIRSDLSNEHWRFIKIKYSKLASYTFQLVDSEFELMSSDHMNKKFTFTSSSSGSSISQSLSKSFNAPQTTLSKSLSSKSMQTSNSLTNHSLSVSPSSQSAGVGAGVGTSFSSSSSNFTIPIEDLCLDKSLIDARNNLNNAKTDLEINEAKQKLEEAESVAENLAILEVNLDNRLLENNVEILVYSSSMSKSVFEKLTQNMIPIYLYGIIDNKLSEKDIKELKELKPMISNHPVLFLKIPEIDKYVQQSSTSSSSSSNLMSSSYSSTSNKTQSKSIDINTNFSSSLNLNNEKQSSSPTTANTGTSSPTSTSTTNLSPQQKLKKANNFLKYLITSSQLQSSTKNSNTFTIFSQLCDLKYLSIIPDSNNLTLDELNSYEFANLTNNNSSSDNNNPYYSMLYQPQPWSNISYIVEGELCEKWHLFLPQFVSFLKKYLKSFSIRGTSVLSKFHEYCLSKFINFAYEMARDMMITPKKIEYAREKEQILFDSLNALASTKQEELKNLINNAIETNRDSILEAAKNFEFVDIELINYNNSNDSSLLNSSSQSIDEQQSSTESFNNSSSLNSSKCVTLKYARDYKKCTNQIQELVLSKINNVIGQKLTQSVEILKENYLGTLKRCLKTLEEMNMLNNLNSNSSSMSDQNAASVSEALQQILNAAYQVEVNISASSSILKILIQRMKEMFNNMPWSASPRLDEEWKVSTATNMLNSLSESKLAKILCNQMRERLESSHKVFISSLKLLEARHNGRLEKAEEKQNLIRKILAPKFAKLCLESTSLKDYVLYGFPSLGKEIGRGQYGVVYSCNKWGKYDNLAVKSVVPPDEKHWNDLALEFHYTKQITDHERIVKLIGSVIDYTYGNGQSPAVLLIMEQMKRDLYQGLKQGIDWKTRIKISLDVVDGIRYLHSLGLVHRDIKLKNVLLDSNNRAKITDLGFCKPEAMMSGSIVGTPVHMCPEMFHTKYDSTVDIYAFGILFWYICSGAVMLPKNFEECSSKDDLWSAVKKGTRPERLASFDDDCWNLMEMCWKHDPKQRPHIGMVAAILARIDEKY